MLMRLVGLVFAFAAVYKSIHPNELASLLSFVGAGWVIGLATLGVIAFESSLGLGLVLRPTNALRRLATITLCVFTVVLIAMLATHDPRSCSCMPRFFNSASANQVFGIGRNVALIGLLIAGKPRRIENPEIA